jgi:hypothetical protein
MHFSFGHACYKPRTSYPPWFDYTNKYLMRSIDYEVPYHVIFSFHQLLLFLCHNIPLGILFSSTLNLHFSFSETDQYWHPYKNRTNYSGYIFVFT